MIHLARLTLFVLLFATSPALAHQSGLSFLNIVLQKDSYLLDVTYKKPLSDTRSTDITITYPSRCAEISQRETQIQNGFIIQKYQLNCTKKALSDSKIWISGLSKGDRGVMVRYQTPQKTYKALLRATSPYIEIGVHTGKIELAYNYMMLGIEHILSGFDHLSFVLGLLLLAPGLKKLLWSISGFTLSHSITLALGVLGTLTLSSQFVESMIALSILFLAKEILLPYTTFTKRHLGVVAFLFGLIHGLGFSSNLTAIGLPHNEIALSLLSFNIGIELGQILFIFLATALLHLFYNYIPKEKLQKTLAYLIGTLASFWLIERLLP